MSTSTPYGGGWRCGCGAWIPMGMTHNCTYHPGYTTPMPVVEGNGILRIAVALERIAEALTSPQVMFDPPEGSDKT